MAPNPRVAKAFRAMKEIGIGEEVVKPVLKNLLKLYDKKWELIEEENYRALADAIFETEETNAAEQMKKPANVDQDEYLEEEPQVHDEPERPLKRLRLRHQGSPSSSNSNPLMGGTSCPEVEESKLPQGCSIQQSQEMIVSVLPNLTTESQPISPHRQLRPRGKQPVSPKSLAAQERSDPSQAGDRAQAGAMKRVDADSPSTQLRFREKGKEPLSPQISPREKRSFPQKSSQGIQLKEPKTEPGIVLLPKKKVHETPIYIKPKNEPITDDMLQYEMPIAILPPDSSCQVTSSFGNNATEQAHDHETPASHCVDEEGKGDSTPASPSERRNNCELANIPEESPPHIEVASSPLGEVKISLSCNSALGIPRFHVPSLDAVLKSVEDKCLRTYKISDPNFSVMKLMRDMCESFLELGTESTDELQEKTIDSLENFSGAQDAQGSRGDEENSIIPPNGSVSIEVALPEILKLRPHMNGMVDRILQEKKTTGNGFCGSDEEKGTKNPEDDRSRSLMDKKEKKSVDDEKSRSLVVSKQQELSADGIRSLFDRDDITRGEERVKITLVNEINQDQPPSFHYIPKNLVFQNAYVNFSLARIGDEDCCSTCFGDCLSSPVPCACARETGGEFAYTSDGLVKEELLEECISMNRDPEKHKHFYCKECPQERSTNDEMAEPCKGHLMRKFIKECWSKCGCSKQCGNRLVQRGITCNLQVFMTAGKGWGIRTLEDLPKGAFVCEYVGEILTNSELYDRNMRSTSSHAYPVLLDADWGAEKVLKDEEALCLDATFYGNVARFLNHRCLDANMVEIPVEVETPDHHYYHLAFFTTRKINAMEELTWDYGIDFDDHDHPVKAFRCRCGSKFCRNMKRSNRSRSAR